MRENFLVHGLAEHPGTDREDCEKTLKSFFVRDLGMDPAEAEAVKISTSHRLGKRRSTLGVS